MVKSRTNKRSISRNKKHSPKHKRSARVSNSRKRNGRVMHSRKRSARRSPRQKKGRYHFAGSLTPRDALIARVGLFDISEKTKAVIVNFANEMINDEEVDSYLAKNDEELKKALFEKAGVSSKRNSAAAQPSVSVTAVPANDNASRRQTGAAALLAALPNPSAVAVAPSAEEPRRSSSLAKIRNASAAAVNAVVDAGAALLRSASVGAAALRRRSSTPQPQGRPSAVRQPSVIAESFPAPSERQPSAVKVPSRQPSAVKVPERQPSAVNVPSRQPSAVKVPERQPSAVKVPERQPSAVKVPERQPSAVQQGFFASIFRSAPVAQEAPAPEEEVDMYVLKYGNQHELNASCKETSRVQKNKKPNKGEIYFEADAKGKARCEDIKEKKKKAMQTPEEWKIKLSMEDYNKMNDAAKAAYIKQHFPKDFDSWSDWDKQRWMKSHEIAPKEQSWAYYENKEYTDAKDKKFIKKGYCKLEKFDEKKNNEAKAAGKRVYYPTQAYCDADNNLDFANYYRDVEEGEGKFYDMNGQCVKLVSAPKDKSGNSIKGYDTYDECNKAIQKRVAKEIEERKAEEDIEKVRFYDVNGKCEAHNPRNAPKYPNGAVMAGYQTKYACEEAINNPEKHEDLFYEIDETDVCKQYGKWEIPRDKNGKYKPGFKTQLECEQAARTAKTAGIAVQPVSTTNEQAKPVMVVPIQSEPAAAQVAVEAAASAGVPIVQTATGSEPVLQVPVLVPSRKPSAVVEQRAESRKPSAHAYVVYEDEEESVQRLKKISPKKHHGKKPSKPSKISPKKHHGGKKISPGKKSHDKKMSPKKQIGKKISTKKSKGRK